MSEANSTRETVSSLPFSTGRFAVMRRRKGAAHYTVTHETFEAASAEAVRLLVGGRIQGKVKQCFMVVEILGQYQMSAEDRPEYEEIAATVAGP